MEQGQPTNQDAITAAVERVAAQRRARHRAWRLPVTEGYLVEAVVALPDGRAPRRGRCRPWW
jgi:hypothetical protein